MGFATPELVGLLRRCAARVSQAHPGTHLQTGDLSARQGGRTRWHSSHQSGRDADILFLARDARARPVALPTFVGFGPDGRSTSHAQRYVFDEERNLALVLALLDDPQVAVQWIFVADWLRDRLVARARADGLDEALIRRLGLVLHQPSDSNPHADHFHVRIYCPVEDRLHGCWYWGPVWSWVDVGDGPWRERAAALERLLDMPAAAYRIRGAEELAEVLAYPAVPRLVTALDDLDGGVRAAALRALRRIGDPTAADGILRRLAAADEPAWATALLAALGSFDDAGLADVARRIVTEPATVLAPGLRDAPPEALLVAAADLLGRHGRAEALQPLLSLVASPRPGVASAAHLALAQVTNQPLPGAGRRWTPAAAKRVAAAWRAFAEAYGEDGWLAWMERGFTRRGARFPDGMVSLGAIPVLVELIGHEEPAVRDNAVRVLDVLTGRHLSPWSRSPRAQLRHWRRWWELNEPVAAR